jgi:hypothetical protein
MRISRRGFLASAGATPLVGLSWLRRTAMAERGGACVLAESRAGFDEAPSHLEERRFLVFPGAVGWDDSLVERVRAGATVLFESAAGFGDATEFAAQRAGLLTAFDLTIEPPAEPWTDRGRPAYIDLHWPAVARLRDFSTVVRVRGGETVGRLGSFPVAARRRLGAGSFLFLGSPIGPALWSGDPQAHAWLGALVAQAGCWASRSS